MTDLVVEDGSIVDGADSYTSLADARTIASKYGYTLPTDDDDANIALRRGMVYVELQESRYNGARVDDSQSTAWPRENASYSYSTGTTIDSDVIPSQLQLAQVIAAQYYGNGVDVRANDDGRSIASQAVSGAVSQSYFNNGKSGKTIEITEVLDALKPLLSSSSGEYTMEVWR